MPVSRSVDAYHQIFVEINGPGPWRCHGCGELVTKLFVHHIDEDPSNNDLSNLVAMHDPCHRSLHHRGKHVSLETRQKMSEAHRGKHRSSETRQKISASMLGKPKTEEHRQNISDGQRRRSKAVEEQSCR